MSVLIKCDPKILFILIKVFVDFMTIMHYSFVVKIRLTSLKTINSIFD